jgi:thymidine kinase
MMEYTPHSLPKNTGWIEAIAGCMFSGKTEELIRRLRRAEIAKQNVMIFKPQLDTRFSARAIVSHSDQSLPSLLIDNPDDIIKLAVDAQVVGIDEAQFFPIQIIDVCNILANQGKRVIVAGLDQDYQGIPFEPMPQLLAIAEYITKTLAICVVCGNPADKTQRKMHSSERVIVGASEIYEARCRRCHYIPKEETL